MKTLAALVLSLLLSAAQSAWIYRQHQTQGRLKNELAAARQALQNARAAHQAYRRTAEHMQKQLDRNHRAHTAAVQNLAAALDQNPQWANTRLPDSVKKTLEQTE